MEEKKNIYGILADFFSKLDQNSNLGTRKAQQPQQVKGNHTLCTLYTTAENYK